jgi:hypothetical protein
MQVAGGEINYFDSVDVFMEIVRLWGSIIWTSS